MKRGESAKLYRRYVRSPDTNTINGKMEGEEDDMEFQDSSLNRRCDDDCGSGKDDWDAGEVVLYSVSPIRISLGEGDEKEQIMDGKLLVTSQRLVFVSSNQLVEVGCVGRAAEGGCRSLCCWNWSPEDLTLDLHSMILHAENSVDPTQPPSIYCQFQEDEALKRCTVHITLFPPDKAVCQHIQENFIALSQRHRTNSSTSDNDNNTYEEATEEQRTTMLARLDAMLVVPPELEIPSECEEEEDELAMGVNQKKKRQHKHLSDCNSYVVEGQFDDADG
jgi:hypothetical protein